LGRNKPTDFAKTRPLSIDPGFETELSPGFTEIVHAGPVSIDPVWLDDPGKAPARIPKVEQTVLGHPRQPPLPTLSKIPAS
jgi:hypothetical protein